MTVADSTAICERALRAALAGIERPLIREWSVKATADRLCEGRYLVSFPRPALGPGPRRGLREICAGLGAPETGLELLDRHQPGSTAVHFGYEPDPGGTVLKCYLEFPPEARPAPDLAFLALKWREDGAYALSHYRNRDGLPASAERDLLDGVVPPGPVRDAIHALLELSSPEQAPRLLEVEESGSPRRSLDLNLMARRERVGDHAALLTAILGGGDEAAGYVAARAGDKLGHVAAGIGRDGRGFATLYHGAHRVFGEL